MGEQVQILGLRANRWVVDIALRFTWGVIGLFKVIYWIVEFLKQWFRPAAAAAANAGHAHGCCGSWLECFLKFFFVCAVAQSLWVTITLFYAMGRSKGSVTWNIKVDEADEDIFK